uniref:Uncharacterized protein n=1 Tax=Panagrolaimus sp. ES5 TaxID=591445 RepID=A0AC34GVD3_9BILA
MATDVEMPLVAPTPPPPSVPRQEGRTPFGFRVPGPEKKPLIPLEEVSLKPIALQFLKLRKNVHNLLQTCSEDSVNGEMVETIKELKTTLRGFKSEFKKLPKINDIREEQQHRIAELLKQIQMKDEFLAKLIGPPLIKSEVEDASIHIEEKPQISDEKMQDGEKKKKEKKLKAKAKDKSASKSQSKDKDGKGKEKTTEKSSATSKSHKSQKDSKEMQPKKFKSKIAENILPSKPKKKPIEKRLVDPAKIRKLKEKIADDKRKRAEVRNAIAKINPENLPIQKLIGPLPKPSGTSNLDAKEKQKVFTQQDSPTKTISLQPELPHSSLFPQKDKPILTQSETTTKDNTQKEDETKNGNEVQPAEEMETQNPPDPPSPPIVKIMPLPGKKLRKPEPPMKSVVTFGRQKFLTKKDPPKNPEDPLKSVLKKPEGVEEEPKLQLEENKNGENQEKIEKVETVKDDKASTWKDLRQMFKKEGNAAKDDKQDQVKNKENTSKNSNVKLSKQYKLRKALKRLAKIQAQQEKRKAEERKKAEEKKKNDPTERMNIFKYFEDEKAKKKALKMTSINASKKSRIVKKIVRKPISRNEQILRKIRRNAINNAQRDGYYTSPLLTIKYISELQNMIENAEKNSIALSSADFRRLRFKYFSCKDSELYEEKLPNDNKRPISKHDIEQLRKINFVQEKNGGNQKNLNITTYQKTIPRTVTDLTMRLPRKEFEENELDQSLYAELTKMGF